MPRETLLTRTILIASLCVPVYWAYLTYRYGVDLPFRDQWDNPAQAIIDHFNHTFNWSSYFAQHNEARKVFPTGISVLLTVVLGTWNTQAELFLLWFLALGIACLIYFALRATHRINRQAAALIFALSILLIWSPHTFPFHVWSIDFERLLPQACLVSGLLCSLKIRSPRHLSIILALLSAIALYSFPSGLVVALVLFCSLIVANKYDARPLLLDLSIFLLIFGSLAAIYFADYHRPQHHSTLSAVAEIPLLKILMAFFAFIGFCVPGPLSARVAIGAAIGAGYLLGLVYAWRNSSEPAAKKETLLWGLLGVYTLGNGALIAVGRIPMQDFDVTVRSEYLMHSIYLAISTIVLTYLGSARWEQSARLSRSGTILACLCLASFHLQGNIEQRFLKNQAKMDFLNSCPLLTNIYVDNECLFKHYPNTDWVKTRINMLADLGALRHKPLKDLASGISPRVSGTIDSIKLTGDTTVFSGAFVSPDAPFHTLVFSQDIAGSESVFALARVYQKWTTKDWHAEIPKSLKINPSIACQIKIYSFCNSDDKLHPLETRFCGPHNGS